MKIELVPDLEHCIETVARKKHAELTHILLKSKEGDTETEEKLETLRSLKDYGLNLKYTWQRGKRSGVSFISMTIYPNVKCMSLRVSVF
jgi:hypothetical protein